MTEWGRVEAGAGPSWILLLVNPSQPHCLLLQLITHAPLWSFAAIFHHPSLSYLSSETHTPVFPSFHFQCSFFPKYSFPLLPIHPSWPKCPPIQWMLFSHHWPCDLMSLPFLDHHSYTSHFRLFSVENSSRRSNILLSSRTKLDFGEFGIAKLIFTQTTINFQKC